MNFKGKQEDKNMIGKQSFSLEEYLTGGVENIVKNAIRATLKDPKESAFMVKFAAYSKEAAKKRKESEKNEHIPPFLIASITSECNLHCAGCYARHNHACTDEKPVEQLTGEEWKKIFIEANELGIGFILLAGGEPLLRKDVLDAAGEIPQILFPVFTNGTMIGEGYLDLFDKKRNLIPIFSIEGYQNKTDLRRGDGTFQKLEDAMKMMQKRKLIFGASITVTTENLREVVLDEFLQPLQKKGCKVVFYVEYVPVTGETKHLAPEEKEREFLKEQLIQLRSKYTEMVFVSFPGDEKSSGGCLAAGRGFFHINSHGGAEPCPFSPYSDINVKDTSLKEALHSKLFQTLQSGELLMEEHEGGCVLYERRKLVEEILG